MTKLLCSLVAALLAVATVPAQDWAKPRLEKSPRHLEWVKVKQGDHEIFGLSDWVRGVTDQLAEAGYIAIAPDLLPGSAPGGGGTAELGSGDAVRKAISALSPDQIPPT